MESDEETDFSKITQRNYKQIENKLQKIGYADGVTAGNENAFQSGFDRGYEDGFRTAFQIGKFKGFYDNLRRTEETDEKERDEFQKMNISKADSKDHFQYLKHVDETLEEISKEQQKYVDEFLHECERRIPCTANLLRID